MKLINKISSIIVKLGKQKSTSITASEEFWQELLRYIEWSDGFCLVFLFAPSFASQTKIVDSFRERLAEKLNDFTGQLQRISPEKLKGLSKQAIVTQIIKQLDSLETGEITTHAPIWVELDRNITNNAISILCARLNERRERLRNHLQRPLIFILPSGYRQQLREVAPDLWSIRNYSFNFGDLEDIEQEISNEKILHKLVAFFQRLPNRLFAVLQWFTDNVQALFSSFHHHYNQYVIFEHRVFNVRGLRTVGTFTLELEQVFVELRIAPLINSNQANFDPVSAKNFTGNHPIWDFLKFKRKKNIYQFFLKFIEGLLQIGNPFKLVYRLILFLLTPDLVAQKLGSWFSQLWGKLFMTHRQVLAVVGAPGCGKTTLLQHTALILATNKQRHYGISNVSVPLLLFLRHHVKQILGDNPPTLHEIAQAYFNNPNKQLNPPPRWFKQRLKNGKCLVLLDGLDEIAEQQQRQAVSAWVDKQIMKYPRCHFIITSRPQGYLDAPLRQAMVLEVQPFNTKQVHQFIHNWYLANEVTAFGGKIDNGVRYRARDAADDLINRLRSLPALTALTVNPLLLTMIAMVHRYRGQLPGRRVELYAEICDVLLGNWRQARGVQDNLTAAQKRVALQPLAAQMMQGKLRDIHTDEARQIIEKPLKRVGLTEQSIQNFLKDVQASSGLLLEGEVDIWRFAHLTFQEYLAAAHFLEQRIKLDWNKVVNDSWWNETLRLYAAQGDATQLVQACLDNNNLIALTLAADCLDEARELEIAIREQIETRLINGLESENFQLRKLAAEVRLNQRLKSLQRIDEQHEIDLDYITCAEYQLFIDEKRAYSQHYQPDHWIKYSFFEGEAKEPIQGVRAEDADNFCEWLNQRHGGNIYYRLPQPIEAKDYPSTSVIKELMTWCKETDTYSLTQLNKETEQHIAMKVSKIFDISSLPYDLNFVIYQVLQPFDIEIDLELFQHALKHSLWVNSEIAHKMTDFENDFARTNDRFLDRTSNFARTLALDHSLDFAYVRHQLKIRDLEQDREHAYNIIKTIFTFLSNPIFTPPSFIDKNIKKENFKITKQQQEIAKFLQAESSLELQRLGTLLYDLSICANAKNQVSSRQAWRKYMLKLTEYLWIGYSEKKNIFRNNSQEKQAILKIYWWLKIIMAREEGKLPAWEGIRIVREQKL